MASRFILPYADVGPGITPEDGAQLFFFESGTSTPKDTYPTQTDAINDTNPNTNPVIANANGVFPDIWIVGSYKVQLFDKDDVQQNPGEWDPVLDTSANEKQISDFDPLASITNNNIIHTKDTANNDATMTVGQVRDGVLAKTQATLTSLDAEDGVGVVDFSADNEIKFFSQDDFKLAFPATTSETLTTLEPSDLVAVVDVSDNNKIKGMTIDNFKAVLGAETLTKIVEPTAVDYTFTSTNVWQFTPALPNAVADKWHWVKLVMPFESNSTVYYRNEGSSLPADDSTKAGRTTSNSIGSLQPILVLADNNGGIQLQSTRLLTVELTVIGVFE